MDDTIMQRLAFIKYLYAIGVEQSKQPEPLGSVGLLSFHDSVELFLQLATEHLNSGNSRPDFMDYFNLAATGLAARANQLGGPSQPLELDHKEAMRRLNKARVALKHHGNMPSRLDLEAFRASTTNFFADNTPRVFGISFDSISMTELVKFTEVHDLVKEGEDFAARGKFPEAMQKLAVAFRELLIAYQRRLFEFTWGHPQATLYNHPNITQIGRLSRLQLRPIVDRQLADNLDTLASEINREFRRIAEAVDFIALGLNHREYVKFSVLTPQVIEYDHGMEAQIEDDYAPSSDEYLFCYTFVVSSALHLQSTAL